jgi:ABC-type nickel/cobalt efflux system permease component RcnA
MNAALLPSIMATGFGVAFFHAAIPSHWLPFVLAARGQRWSRGKTLAVTALAGLGHVLFTTLLGVLVVWLGIETSRLTGSVFPFMAGGILILFGLYYVMRHARGGGHGHVHFFGSGHGHSHHPHDHPHEHDHDHGHEHPHGPSQHSHDDPPSTRRSDAAVILGLLAVLTFSPCEGFLPVYLSGIHYGWSGFLFLSAVLAAATLAGMVAFTWLSLAGLERLKLAVLERYESAILGGLLIFLGIAVMVFET